MTTTINTVFNDEKTPGSLLLTLFVEQWGREALDYDPFVVKKQLKELLREDCPRVSFNKLMGALNLVKSNEFWKDLPSFIILSNALAYGKFDTRVVDLATIPEINIAIADSLIIWPEEPTEFSDQIIDYINHMFRLQGYFIPPRLLNRLFGDRIQTSYEKLAPFQDDPILFNIIFEVAKQRTKETDEDILELAQKGKEYSEALGLEDVGRLYEALKEDLFMEKG